MTRALTPSPEGGPPALSEHAFRPRQRRPHLLSHARRRARRCCSSPAMAWNTPTFDEQLPTFSQAFPLHRVRHAGDRPERCARAGYTTARDGASTGSRCSTGIDVGAGARRRLLARWRDRPSDGPTPLPSASSTLSLYSSFDRPDPYLRLRYELLVKILLEIVRPRSGRCSRRLLGVRRRIHRRPRRRGPRRDRRRMARWQATTRMRSDSPAITMRPRARSDRAAGPSLPHLDRRRRTGSGTPPSYSQRMQAAIPARGSRSFPTGRTAS